MSKCGVIITTVAIVLIASSAAKALLGSGTEEGPWLIRSLADFDEFAGDPNYWEGCTRLETDVNLVGRVYGTAVIGSFSGVFDGNDHKIIDLTIDDGGAGNDYLGLFATVSSGQVMNLGLEGGYVRGAGDYVGGLAGENDGTITNCYVTSWVIGDEFVGGLAGRNNDRGTVSYCYSTGDVTGAGEYIGGLVGYNGFAGRVWRCHCTGDVSGYAFVGGLAGYIHDYGRIAYSYSIGDVNGLGYVGGLVGEHSRGWVWDCYSTGDVDGFLEVGGLMGKNLGYVEKSYSAGDVNGVVNVGGLMGSNRYYALSCFWDGDTQTHGVRKSFGAYLGTADVLGLATAEMQTRSTYTDADWDLINVWDIGEKQTYPYFRTVLPSDLNKDRITNFLDLAVMADQWMNGE